MMYFGYRTQRNKAGFNPNLRTNFHNTRKYYEAAEREKNLMSYPV